MITVDPEGSTTVMRSIVVFRAADWEAARARAIELGRAAEESYRNAADGRVERRLMRIETLDLLGDEIVDGREVYSEFSPIGDERTDGVLDPDGFRPSQTGV